MVLRYAPMKIVPSHRESGFTLIEMLVVMLIIGLLAGLVGPKLFGHVDRSKVQAAQAQVKMLKGALETMRLDLNRFPTADEGLQLLTTQPTDDKLRSRWKGPYLDDASVPLDPWGNPYQYSLPGPNGQPFALYSFGPEGKKGEGNVGILPPQ